MVSIFANNPARSSVDRPEFGEPGLRGGGTRPGGVGPKESDRLNAS
jgi:hypothetical protein